MAAGECQVTFMPDSDGPAHAGIASIDEEVLVNSEWVRQRRLNGDEDGQGQFLHMNSDGVGKATIYRVRLYRY